jgi:hypothetical protein
MTPCLAGIETNIKAGVEGFGLEQWQAVIRFDFRSVEHCIAQIINGKK